MTLIIPYARILLGLLALHLLLLLNLLSFPLLHKKLPHEQRNVIPSFLDPTDLVFSSLFNII